MGRAVKNPQRTRISWRKNCDLLRIIRDETSDYRRRELCPAGVLCGKLAIQRFRPETR